VDLAPWIGTAIALAAAYLAWRQAREAGKQAAAAQEDAAGARDLLEQAKAHLERTGEPLIRIARRQDGTPNIDSMPSGSPFAAHREPAHDITVYLNNVREAPVEMTAVRINGSPGSILSAPIGNEESPGVASVLASDYPPGSEEAGKLVLDLMATATHAHGRFTAIIRRIEGEAWEVISETTGF
jgi:hypothetical protein